MSRRDRPGHYPPADLKLSGEMVDLPLDEGAADLEITKAQRGLPAELPTEVRPAPAAPRTRRWPWLAAVAAALAAGALGGWLLKPDPAVAVLSSGLLDFGEVRLAATSDGQGVEVTNVGQRALPVTRVALSGEAAGEFALAADSCSGQALAAQASCRLEVTFTPAATGARRAWLDLEGAALNRLPRLPLLGLGVAPQLEAEPLALDFGEHLVGTRSSRSTLRVANRGSAPLAIRSVELAGGGAGDFAVDDGCSGRSLAPGERCALELAFLPTVEGDRQATVRLRSGGGDALAPAPELRGRGLARQAALAVEPRRLDFAPQLAGTASEARTVTLTNAGTAPLAFEQLAVRSESPEPPFELAAGECAERPLAAGRSCAVGVLFRPPAEGRFAAVLEIRHGAGAAPRRVPLAGDGTAPEIFLDPLVLDFGPVPVGRTSDSRFLRVVNSGTGPLEIAEIRLSGSGAQAFTARPVGCTTAPVKPKSSCGVEVRFKPHRGGAFSAEVVLAHSAADGPDRIELRGLGKMP